MTIDRRTALSAAMFAIFAGAAAMAFTLPSQAAFMPLLVGIPGALLCALQLVLDLRRPAPEARPERPRKRPPTQGRSEGEMFAWLGGFTAVLVGFGFLWGGPVLVALFVRYFSRQNWVNTGFAALGTFAVLYGIFDVLLGLTLFPGLIVPALP